MSSPQILTHMSRKDMEVFATYYFTPEGQSFQHWEFDIIVGDPEDPGMYYPPNIRRQALYLNSLKIDALAWFYNSPLIIECKPNATAGAIGQVLTYKTWYKINFDRECSTMIVCSRMAKQLVTMCNINEIAVRVVPQADSLTIQQCIQSVAPKVTDRSKQLLYSALQSL